jgi:hypothetical protein
MSISRRDVIMHDWADDTIDWKGINAAAHYIYHYLKRWGVPVRDYKEKYGTVRVYTGFGFERGWLMNTIFYPGHMYYRFPQWVRRIDYMIPIHWLNPIAVPFHMWLYKRAYRNAIRKWPHLREEILHGADYSELLKEHGIHRVRDSENGYTIYYDWHPENYSARHTNKEEEDGDVSIPL